MPHYINLPGHQEQMKECAARHETHLINDATSASVDAEVLESSLEVWHVRLDLHAQDLPGQHAPFEHT